MKVRTIILGLMTTVATHAWAFNPYCGKLSFQLGGAIVHQGKAQDIGIVGLIGDRFTVTQHNATTVLLGLGYYIDDPKYNLSYGFNAFYLPHAVVKGKVIQEALFTNLSYQYATNNLPVYLMGKKQWRYFLFDIGVGPNFLQTRNVTEKSLDGITIPDNIFSGKTTIVLSATFGVAMKLNTIVPMECGYRFFYLGKGYFDKTSNQITNTLDTGNGYANALACSMEIPS